MPENTNPLNKYFRQSAVYISLPTGGNYAPTVLEKSQTGEIGVMPMTARDEIKFKTPDALMNGQGVVDVVESCIPQIKDAWQISNYDLDTILIAIRIATYGETMDINFNVPITNEQLSHTVNLPALLEQIKSQEIVHEITLKDGLKIHVRPLTYKDMTKASIKTFQQQKMYTAVQDSKLSNEEKVKRFDESFKALTDLSASILLKNISKIVTPDGAEVSDPAQIKEFIDNANATLINELSDELTKIRLQGSVKPLQLKATEEQIKKGVPVSYEVPITFDTANFFV
jgi:hypothetical protein